MDLGKLLSNLFEIKESLLNEARDKEKKEKLRRAKEKAAKARPKTYDPDYKESDSEDEPDQPMRPGKTLSKKIKSGEKSEKDLEKGDTLDKATGKVTKARKSSKFTNTETLKDTPEDAHLHSDGDCKEGLRGKTASSRYAKTAGEDKLKKSPCEKSYPIFGGKNEKARILGGLRMAYQYHDKAAISKLSAAAAAIGIHAKGALWNERPECKGLKKGQVPRTKDGKALPAKYCEKHGEGGPDEWLRGSKHRGDAKKEGGHSSEHKTTRSPGTGHSDSKKAPLRDHKDKEGIRMPSKFASKIDKLRAAKGSEHGAHHERVTRNFSRSTLAKHGLKKDSDQSAVLHGLKGKLEKFKQFLDKERANRGK